MKRHVVVRGCCYDCSQGLLTVAEAGFEYWDEDDNGRGFWFCRYCGSNHVSVTLDDDVVVDQGNLYNSAGLPNF